MARLSPEGLAHYLFWNTFSGRNMLFLKIRMENGFLGRTNIYGIESHLIKKIDVYAWNGAFDRTLSSGKFWNNFRNLSSSTSRKHRKSAKLPWHHIVIVILSHIKSQAPFKKVDFLNVKKNFEKRFKKIGKSWGKVGKSWGKVGKKLEKKLKKIEKKTKKRRI